MRSEGSLETNYNVHNGWEKFSADAGRADIGSSDVPRSSKTNTKWPKQLTAKVLSTPSLLKTLKGGKAMPALPTMISSLPSSFSPTIFLNSRADFLELSTLDKSSSWKCIEPLFGWSFRSSWAKAYPARFGALSGAQM
jgi:hypothetical protein